MTKRLSSKLLSVILALAICATTVFGCLMTVSAASVPALTFSPGISTDEKLTKAKIQLTVDIGDADGFIDTDEGVGGIVAFQTELSYDDNLTLEAVDATKGTKIDGTTQEFSADESEDSIERLSDGFVFEMANADNVNYRAITFTLSFTLKNSASNGDKLNVKATSASVAGIFSKDPYEITNAATGTIVMGCDHKIEPTGALLKEDAVNGYAIYENAKCTGTCGYENFGIQVVPTKLPSGTTLYWDGTKAEKFYSDTDGASADNPIIIDTAEKLAYVASAKYADTYGKYFKIADGIDKIVLQSETYGADIVNKNSATDVKAYFEGIIADTSKARPFPWVCTAYDSSVMCFAGNFDGNGAEIYGLYASDASVEGSGANSNMSGSLFGIVDGAHISNFALKNSYVNLRSGAASWKFGLIAAYGKSFNNVDKDFNSIVYIDSLIVANNYAYKETNNSSTNASGTIFGGHDNAGFIVQNILVYGNDVIAYDSVKGASYDLPIYGSARNSVSPTDEFAKAHPDWVFESCVKSVIEDSVILGNALIATGADGTLINTQHRIHGCKDGYSCFKNVYTDWAVEKVIDTDWFKKASFLEKGGKIISAANAKGEAAKTNMPALFDEESDVWAVDVNRGYPTFKQSANPDSVNTTSDYGLTLLGTNNEYKNDGTYNFNFYYRPKSEYINADIDLYVAQLSEDKSSLGSFRILEGTPLSESEATAIGLDEGDIRYTIENLSAREIHNSLLATAVAVKDGKAVWGETAEISIAKYAKNIIDGDYAEADKNLAEAVLKYGEAAALALNTKNDSNTGTTLYWNGKKANKFYGESDGTSANNPIIINTAEEFVYVATAKKEDTTGKYFKMADGIDKVVLQSEAVGEAIVGLDSATAVKEYFEPIVASDVASKANTLMLWPGNTWNAETMCFAGTFDGNGVEFYGMYNTNKDVNTNYTHNSGGGLFCVADGATITNLSVKNSYTNIGSSSSSWQFGLMVSYGQSNIITIDRCTFANNYIEKIVADASIKNCGLVVGYNGNAVVMENILVYGNETKCTLTSGSEYKMSIVGGAASQAASNEYKTAHPDRVDGSNYAFTALENSVILDNPILATNVDGTEVLYTFWNLLPANSSANGYKNVYTDWDVSKITKVTPDSSGNTHFYVDYFLQKGTVINASDAMGVAAMTKMPKLDWENTWCYGDTYPSLAKGSYTSASGGKTIYWNGAMPTDANKFYADTDGASAENPIIIDTAEKLAYVATASFANTNGKYFKVADGISKIVLQSEAVGASIVGLNSASAVKEYFEGVVASDIAANRATLHGWAGYTWKEDNTCFGGYFDGNGVEIYGMYSSTTDINPTITNRSLHGGASATGLFVIADNATISNLTMKNSYVNIGTKENAHANYSHGLIVGFGKNMNGANDPIYVNNCTVANNYIYKKTEDSNMWRSGLVCGGCEGNGAFVLQNILVYGNDATGVKTTAGTEYRLGIVGGLSKKAVATDEYKAAHPKWVHPTDGYMFTMLENSVILDTPLLPTNMAKTEIVNNQWTVLNCDDNNDCYENVYTDWNVNNVTDYGQFKKASFLSKGGTVISASDVIGDTDTAKSIVNSLNTANGDTVWYTGNKTYLGFNPPTDMLPGAQAAYDAITFNIADNYGTSNLDFGIYATSLNLKTSPYISFAFAFNGAYKRDRQNISVTFKYTVNGKEVTTDAIKVEENGALVEGWENGSNSGRYHVYRFKDIPVEALCDEIEVTVAYNGDVAEKKTVTGTFSVEGFGLELVNAYKKAPCNYYATRIEAVKALLFYTQMLQARYGAQA